MAVVNGIAEVSVNIQSITDRRKQKVKAVLFMAGREMLSTFQTQQFGSPQEDPPKKIGSATKGASKALSYAKEHEGGAPFTKIGTPWTNRSFRAARGVYPYVREDKDMIAVGFAHRMPYGAYLEYGNNRKYAVLEPIARMQAPKILEAVRKIMGN